MTVPISIVIPVGPLPRHYEHLQECLDSLDAQTERADEVLIIDNGKGLRDPLGSLGTWHVANMGWWEAPWAMGLATGFNVGIALAVNEFVFMLGSDDTLYPRCLELCYAAWQRERQPLGWYFVGVRDSSGYEQNTASMAAMVTKTLWQATGGFELGSDYGRNSQGIATSSCEIAFISKMLLAEGKLGATYRVSDEILYFWRKHE